MMSPVDMGYLPSSVSRSSPSSPPTGREERPAFDLQSHSTASDGALAPAAVVAAAATAGVRLLALSDHDTVAGVPEALAAAARHGIALTPAAELSAVHGDFEDLHVVGYELDHTDGTLLDALAGFRADRGRRIGLMAERLRELGFALEDAAWAGRDAVGRPHLADAVLADPRNAERLAAEGIAGKRELFPAYLVPGAPAYVARSRPTVAEAIAAIHAAGGVAVWAHPFWDTADPDVARAGIETFAADGLDGVEVFYPAHDEAQTRLLHAAATGRGLLATGSSDFHGPGHEHFSAFRAFALYGLEPHLGPIGSRAGYRV
jgi:3',5'-nucleoside bisphosphate phosphatase